MRAGEVVKKNFGRLAALKRSKGFCVTEAALASVDHTGGTTFLGHERDKLVMVGHAAVRTEQGSSLPLAAAAAAAEISASFDPSHFGKRRPGAADRTIPLRPARRFRCCPSPIARVQQGDGQECCNRLERLRICTEIRGNVLKAIAILAK